MTTATEIIELKKTFHALQEQLVASIEQLPDYHGEADGLIRALDQVQKELEHVHTQEEFIRLYEKMPEEFSLIFNYLSDMDDECCSTGCGCEETECEVHEDDSNLVVLDYEDDEEMDEEDEDQQFLDLHMEWFDQFCESARFKNLTLRQQESAEAILMAFSDFLLDLDEADPTFWEQETLEEICLDLFPKAITAEVSFFEDTGPVLIAFFEFLASQNLLEQAEILVKYLKSIHEMIPKIAADTENWGPAKAIAMQAMKE